MKQYLEGEEEPDHIIYQFRIKSDTDDYLGIFRVLTVIEVTGGRLLRKEIEEHSVSSQKSMGKLQHPASLLSFDKNPELH